MSITMAYKYNYMVQNITMEISGQILIELSGITGNFV